MRSKSTIGLVLWLIVAGTTSTAFAQASGTFNGRVVDAGGGCCQGRPCRQRQGRLESSALQSPTSRAL